MQNIFSYKCNVLYVTDKYSMSALIDIIHVCVTHQKKSFSFFLMLLVNFVE